MSEPKEKPMAETKTAPAGNAAGEELKLNKGDVLIRKVRGAESGAHPEVGLAVIGRLYTVAVVLAVQLTDGASAEFEPARISDATAINAEREAQRVARIEAAKKQADELVKQAQK